MRNSNKLFIHLSLIGFITATIYLFSFNNNFVWDDISLILHNDKIHHFSQIPKLFFNPFFDTADMDGPDVGGYYRPLTVATFALDWFFWKQNPLGYHLTNLLLHLVNAFMVYGLIRFLLRPPAIAFWTALLFAVHPLQVDSVAYISGRTDLLAVTFVLGTFLLILFKDRSRSQNRLLAVGPWICYAAALLSKEIGVVVGPFLFLYWLGLEKKSLKQTLFRLLPFIAITLVYFPLRQAALNLPPGEPAAHLSGAFWRFLSVLPAWFETMFLFFWPYPIYFERFQVHYEHWIPQMGWGIGLLAVYLGLLLILWKKNRPLFLMAALYGLALLPVMELHPLYVQEYLFWTEHFYYLPGIGFFALLVSGAAKLIKKMPPLRKPLTAAAAGMVLIFCVVSWSRIEEWQNEINLFTKALRYNPNSARAHNNLAIQYQLRGMDEKAIAHLEKAIELNPYSPGAYNNLGNIYNGRKEFDKAAETYDQAIQAGANTPGIFTNLAHVFIQQEEWGFAEEIYLRALPRVKNKHEIYNQLGMLYIRRKNEPSAMLMFQKALDLKPDFILALNNAGILLAKTKQYEKAEALFKKALDWNPELADAYLNLGNLYTIWKKYAQAEDSFRKALELAPYDPGASEGLKLVQSKRESL